MIEECKKCHLPVSVDDFWPDQRYLSGHQPWCKKCYKTYQKARHYRNLALSRRKRYGVSIEAQEKLMESQQWQCAACGVEIDRSAHLDHDHKNGRVRAFLCSPCNRVIGHSKENADRLLGCAEYVQKYWKGET